MKQKKYSTRTVVLIGLFAAICYVSLYLRIPIPSPVGRPFLHMGNMFVILAALLFNGFIGGAAGSLGMGLYDIVNGYGSSALRTFVLKFGIGVVVGKVAAKKRDAASTPPVKWILTAGIAFFLIGAALSVTARVKGYQISVPGVDRELVISPALCVLLLALGAVLTAAGFFSKRYSVEIQYAILGAVAGIAFNAVGEFLWKTAVLLIAGSSFYPAVIASAFSLPATLINGVSSIIVAVALYIPLSKTVAKYKV
ncbi:MAG: ECF transporter S component [Limnochordia bacterium]|jgi:uncharacterized membrane protein|nr:ECF transporter S component [Bacillota bacterium]HOB08741.1 ECF transporter S component [Limnochordia bacterium]NLH31693.1 hypothetical protein [Bacillota bacterium]HPT92776.1 ECF transporter S component [Limnochordia bacterium]HPZ30795.1 ECF transporter S component [Limnochordia bacterium]